MLKYGTAIALVAMLGLGLAATTFASDHGQGREETALQGTGLTLSQAIATAEQQTGGKAYDASVDVEHGKRRIAVETTGPQGRQTVMIGVPSGKVIAVHAGEEEDED